MADQLEQEIERALDQASSGQASAKPIESDGPLVLFGAGHLGRAALSGLRRIGIEPAAWADNNPRLHGTLVEGLPVLSAAAASEKFGRTATFVVTIYTGAGVRRQLTEMGLRAFGIASLFRQFPDTFLPYCCLDRPDKLTPHRGDILRGLKIWADDASRNEYLTQIRYRAGIEEPVGPANAGEMYFPEDLVRPGGDEVFVDCGAYDGDTLKTFLERTSGSFRRIVALEPDPENFRRLGAFAAGLPENLRQKIQLEQAAVGSRRETLHFEASGSVSSQVKEGGTYEVRSLPLDEVLADVGPTWIKMDIEGSEAQALEGGRRVISEYLPVLGVCLYHRLEDLWNIPLSITALSDQYRLFLQRHSDDCWEQICYAVPIRRLSK
jgi:FkbM family methyltransferase